MTELHDLRSKTLMCVDKYNGVELSGRLFNVYFNKPIYFYDLYDLLMDIERILDKLNFPMPDFAARGFGACARHKRKPENEELTRQMSDEIFETERGEKATFIVQVQFRQNATWQGTLTWTDGKKTQKFRSALELLKLMSGVLETDCDKTVTTWCDEE